MDLGLYQRQVAKLLGVTADTVCYWENNRVTPSRGLLPRLLQFLDGHDWSDKEVVASEG
jgi:transcriptional regulator with XRE-family HTH domain